jgi:hypothetical protein
MGYQNVKEYREGKSDWVHAGLPTEGAAPPGRAGSWGV